VVLPLPNDYSSALPTFSAPSFKVDEERLTKSTHVAYRLALAKIEHEGKNTPTTHVESKVGS
jgi:hypothetical protein